VRVNGSWRGLVRELQHSLAAELRAKWFIVSLEHPLVPRDRCDIAARLPTLNIAVSRGAGWNKLV
jgi:hypothetical protein